MFSTASLYLEMLTLGDENLLRRRRCSLDKLHFLNNAIKVKMKTSVSLLPKSSSLCANTISSFMSVWNLVRSSFRYLADNVSVLNKLTIYRTFGSLNIYSYLRRTDCGVFSFECSLVFIANRRSSGWMENSNADFSRYREVKGKRAVLIRKRYRVWR